MKRTKFVDVLVRDEQGIIVTVKKELEWFNGISFKNVESFFFEDAYPNSILWVTFKDQSKACHKLVYGSWGGRTHFS